MAVDRFPALTGCEAIMDRCRHLKVITVFSLAMLLSLIHQNFYYTLYPLCIITVIAFICKSPKWDLDGYSKIAFYLTFCHTVVHYFVDSYYEDKDIPLLVVDMLVHHTYGWVAIFHFKAKYDMLSKDPLMKFANGITKWVWIPGGIFAIYMACFHGNTPEFHRYMRLLGGFSLSTGTAMEYCNIDFLFSHQPNSSRQEQVKRKGITSHGIQIIAALTFAVLYIATAGGQRWVADMLEYDLDYASHLYLAYAFL